MKILLTTHVFLPEHAAGTEILTFHSAKELQARGHDVEICTGFFAKPGLKDEQRFDSYEYEGLTVRRFHHDLSPMGHQSNIVELEYDNRLYRQWFTRHLLNFKPDIVQFFHLGLLSASVIDACDELGIPMVMTPTDYWLVCPNYQLRLPDNSPCRGPDRDGVNCLKHAVARSQPKPVAWMFNHLPYSLVAGMKRAIEGGALSGAKFSPQVTALSKRPMFLKERMNKLSRVVVPSQLMADLLIENGLDPQKIVHSRFGIRPTPSVVRKPASDGRLRIGFIGGLSEHKGAHLLISAFRSSSHVRPMDLKIYGRMDLDPRYSERLLKLAAGDDRITFCGTFPNDQIGHIFSELDVLVVPSIWYENTPLVMYSAQAAGCPIIATNLGGMSEVVKHEVNGLLFEREDVAGLGAAIERLADDPSLLKRLAAHAIQPKSISDYTDELLLIYDELLTESLDQK
ncbi:MAG: glycosyltransferase family 4 protein [Burkholderiaceae bacterium]|nr:glycosyltransferase family 4 protein [Burkholderiaceae bacterium]